MKTREVWSSELDRSREFYRLLRELQTSPPEMEYLSGKLATLANRLGKVDEVLAADLPSTAYMYLSGVFPENVACVTKMLGILPEVPTKKSLRFFEGLDPTLRDSLLPEVYLVSNFEEYGTGRVLGNFTIDSSGGLVPWNPENERYVPLWELKKGVEKLGLYYYYKIPFFESDERPYEHQGRVMSGYIRVYVHQVIKRSVPLSLPKGPYAEMVDAWNG